MRFTRRLGHVPLARFGAALAVLLAVGCRLLDDRCGPFIRELTVTGNTTTPATLFAQISLVDQREGETTTRIFSWLVQGGSLRPGLVGAELVDSQTGERWATLPITSVIADQLSSGNSSDAGWVVPWEDVRARIANGRGRVRLTYAAPAPPILLPLTVVRSTGFEQPHCS